MSDEIKTGTTININAVPKCIDESATALAKPTATEIGSLLKDIIYLKASEIHFQAEKMRITYECELKLFKESVTQALETKPSECLVEPRLQIVGQTAEKARFCIEEPEIREMFKNLLVNAADIRYQSKIHPSFAGIIEQMAPLDAQNLALFKKQDSYPIVEYHMVFDNRQYNIKYPNTFLANPNEPDYDLQAASISSLERHGLIQTNYTVCLADKNLYNDFEKFPQYLELKTQIGQYGTPKSLEQSNSKIVDVTIHKGVVSLTPLGSAFIKVCFES